MKHHSVLWLLAALALLLPMSTGCGGPSEKTIEAEDNPSFGPHNGPLVSLSDVDGFVEVVNEDAAGGVRFVAYFYQTEAAQSALATKPTDVRISLALPDGSSQEIPLESAPMSNETGRDARFVSGPIDLVVDQLMGTVNATISGQSVSASFSTKHY